MMSFYVVCNFIWWKKLHYFRTFRRFNTLYNKTIFRYLLSWSYLTANAVMLPRKGLIFHLKCVSFLALLVVYSASGCEYGTGETTLSKVTNALNLLKRKCIGCLTQQFYSSLLWCGSAKDEDRVVFSLWRRCGQMKMGMNDSEAVHQ